MSGRHHVPTLLVRDAPRPSTRGPERQGDGRKSFAVCVGSSPGRPGLILGAVSRTARGSKAVQHQGQGDRVPRVTQNRPYGLRRPVSGMIRRQPSAQPGRKARKGPLIREQPFMQSSAAVSRATWDTGEIIGITSDPRLNTKTRSARRSALKKPTRGFAESRPVHGVSFLPSSALNSPRATSVLLQRRARQSP